MAEAVTEPTDSAGLFTTLLDRFSALGGVDLEVPPRDEAARAAERLRLLAGFAAVISASCG